MQPTLLTRASKRLSITCASEKILAALNPSETHQFFPNGVTSFPRSSITWIDPTPLSDHQWKNAWREINPTILVSCWSTPRIPVLPDSFPAPELRYVCHIPGSVKKVVPRDWLAHELPVTNWGTLAARTVAEHALLLTLAALRNLPRWRETMLLPIDRQQPVIRTFRTATLHERRVGLHGFGAVAQEIVKLLKSFNVQCASYSAGVPPEIMTAVGVKPCRSLAQLFAHSEILIECEALTPNTERSVTTSLLRKLPDGGVFINIGRGAVVDEQALALVAAEKELRVGSDVFANEPLARDSKLWDLPCGVYSPHIAGPTQDCFPMVGAFALANIERFLNSEPLEGIVTLAAYDRST